MEALSFVSDVLSEVTNWSAPRDKWSTRSSHECGHFLTRCSSHLPSAGIKKIEPHSQYKRLKRDFLLSKNTVEVCDITCAWREGHQNWKLNLGDFRNVTGVLLKYWGQSRSVPAEETEELQEIFNGLVQTWKAETGGYSVTTKRYAHSSYQAILGLGKEAVPLILRELELRPDFWFEALTALAKPKENPVRPNLSFEQAVEAWLDWGRRNNLI